MRLNQLIALVAFAAVATGSPGPNNTLLLASGINFGFRRTVPHVVGTSVGMLLLVGIAAVGEGLLVDAVPRVQLVLKLAASAYLIYLAIRLAGGVALDPAAVRQPFGVRGAAAFQFVNPKSWVFALALVSAFASTRGSGITARVAVVGVVPIVVIATAAIWAAGGTTLGRTLEGDRARRVAGVVLGVLLVASVAFIWV